MHRIKAQDILAGAVTTAVLLLLLDNHTVGTLSVSIYLIPTRALRTLLYMRKLWLGEVKGLGCFEVNVEPTTPGATQRAGRHEAQNTPRSLRTPIPTTRKQGDKLPGSSWIVFLLFVQPLCSTMHSAGQAAPWAPAAPLAAETKQQECQGALPHQLPATRHAAWETDKREVPGLVT